MFSTRIPAMAQHAVGHPIHLKTALKMRPVITRGMFSAATKPRQMSLGKGALFSTIGGLGGAGAGGFLGGSGGSGLGGFGGGGGGGPFGLG